MSNDEKIEKMYDDNNQQFISSIAKTWFILTLVFVVLICILCQKFYIPVGVKILNSIIRDPNYNPEFYNNYIITLGCFIVYVLILVKIIFKHIKNRNFNNKKPDRLNTIVEICPVCGGDVVWTSFDYRVCKKCMRVAKYSDMKKIKNIDKVWKK